MNAFYAPETILILAKFFSLIYLYFYILCFLCAFQDSSCTTLVLFRNAHMPILYFVIVAITIHLRFGGGGLGGKSLVPRGDNFSPRMPWQWYVRGGGEGKRRILIG
jgi:hypothetical protein